MGWGTQEKLQQVLLGLCQQLNVKLRGSGIALALVVSQQLHLPEWQWRLDWGEAGTAGPAESAQCCPPATSRACSSAAGMMTLSVA